MRECLWRSLIQVPPPGSLLIVTFSHHSLSQTLIWHPCLLLISLLILRCIMPTAFGGTLFLWRRSSDLSYLMQPLVACGLLVLSFSTYLLSRFKLLAKHIFLLFPPFP